MPDIEVHGPLMARDGLLMDRVINQFLGAEYAGDLTFADHRTSAFIGASDKPFVRVFGSLPMRESRGPDIRKRLRDLNVFEGVEWVEISWRPM